jgi:hypothetical protein
VLRQDYKNSKTIIINMLSMKSRRRLWITVAGVLNAALLALLVCHITLKRSHKKLLKEVDVYAEPLKERINEFIDIITVSFDKLKETVLGPVEKSRIKPDRTGESVKTTPGRYVKAKA